MPGPFDQAVENEPVANGFSSRRSYIQGRNDSFKESWLPDFGLCPSNDLPVNVAIQIDCDPDLFILHARPP